MLVLYLSPSGTIQIWCYQQVSRYQMTIWPNESQWIVPGTVDPMDP